MTDMIMQLATAAASTLATSMATKLWTEVRERVVRLFSRGDSTPATDMEKMLAESYERVHAAPEDERTLVIRDVEGEWRGALRHLLTTHPDAASDVREFLGRYTEEVSREAASTGFHQTVNVHDRGTAYAAGRDQINILRADRDGD